MEKFYILHYIELRRCLMLNVDSNYNLACFVCGPGVVSRRWRGTARQHQTLCHSLVWMLIDDFIIHSYIVTQRVQEGTTLQTLRTHLYLPLERHLEM